MDDAQSIRAVLDVLVPSDSLRALLGDEFWRLGQRRNLIVHRRALVDEIYVRCTGDSTAIGADLVISPQYLMGSLELAGMVGIELAKALLRHFPSEALKTV